MSLQSLEALPMPADYFQLALRRFGTTPAKQRELLEHTGFSEPGAEPVGGRSVGGRSVGGPSVGGRSVGGPSEGGPRETIRLGQQLAQVRNLNRHGPEGWGLELGSALGDAAHGDLAVAASCAPDLGTALDTLAEFGHVRAPYFELTVESDVRWHRIIVRDLLDAEPAIRPPLIETLLLSVQAMVESALGRPMTEARFRIGYEAPAYADRYPDFFHAAVAFGASHTEIRFPSEWRHLACPFADPGRHAAAVERLASFMRALVSPTYLVAQVERALEASPQKLPSQEAVARTLGLSRRSLARRLADHDVSFRDLVAGVRQRRALTLLADATLSVAEISDRLGYGDAANFGRAVRRWYACSPSALRERLRREASRTV